MTAAERANAYLQIPAEYGGTLGGLVWSASGDAIECWDGTTFAFAEEVRDVLAGVFARPPVPPFEFVLALLRTMLDGIGPEAPNGQRLRYVFASNKRTSQLLRNAGGLIAELCCPFPHAANVPSEDDVARVLGRPLASNAWVLHEVPPLPRDEFARRIEARLASYDDARLKHWLTIGCEPLGEIETLAEPLDTLPVRVEKLLAIARVEPRLRGAASLVPTLDGALTLPARRRTPDALPQGGYCDVTTRGEPDRLLPGQFALDPDEFIRRFAENELLYFQREEPHATRRPERLIVLDQGVRTWGGVRLTLAAAALVSMRKEAKRVGRVRFATTGSPMPVDVQESDVEHLAKSLEASDLTATPAECLSIARTRSDADVPRDIVLLTHPRALREPAVQSILTDLAAEDRVFALVVEANGASELVQWKEAGPDVVRRFRIDLAAAEAIPIPAGTKPASAFESGVWTGDIEPVPFPFRPGLVATMERMGFDADGEWLVVASRQGILQAMGTNGDSVEVLPRAFRDGIVLRTVDAVLGVPGGVAVCGRMTSHSSITLTSHSIGSPVSSSSASEDSQAERFIVAHYDRKSRRVAMYDLGPWVAGGFWSAHFSLNCVMLTLDGGRGAAVDLASKEVLFGPGEDGTSRVEVARWKSRQGYRSSPHELRILDRTPDAPIRSPSLQMVANGMIVHLGSGSGEFRLMPMQDGKFLLGGGVVVRASLAGNTLALVQKRGKSRFLIAIDCSSHRVLGETQVSATRDQFALSADGRFIAYTRPRFRSLCVAPVGELNAPRAEARAIGLHDKLQLAFNEQDVLRIGIGQHVHTFSVRHGSLHHAVSQGKVNVVELSAVDVETRYDRERFPPKESARGYRWVAVSDRLGQVLVFRKSGTLAAAVLVRRDRAAVWCPGGIFWGDPSLIGGPPTPHAAEAIANFVMKLEAT